MPRKKVQKTRTKNTTISASQDGPAPQDVPVPQLDLSSNGLNGMVAAKVSLLAGANYPIHDSRNAQYIRDVRVVSQDQFSLEATTITEGPFKGHQAIVLVPVPKRHFRFLDLPIEIRLMVYRQLFVPRRYDSRKQHIVPSGYSNRLHFTWEAAILQEGRHHRSVSERHVLGSVKMLRTNKQILAEASSILYGDNYWRFATATVLRIWLEEIGPFAISKLRTVELCLGGRDTYVRASVKRAAVLLAEARNLQYLRFDTTDCHRETPYVVPDLQLIRDWEPVFRMMFSQGGMDTIKRRVRLGRLAEFGRDGCSMHRFRVRSEDCPRCLDIRWDSHQREVIFFSEMHRTLFSDAETQKALELEKPHRSERPQRQSATKKRISYAELTESSGDEEY